MEKLKTKILNSKKMKQAITAAVTAFAIFAAQCGTAVGVVANAEVQTAGVYDTFNSYADASALCEVWQAEDAVKEYISLEGDDGKNRAMVLTTSSSAGHTVKRNFDASITADKFTVEMTVKAATGFDVSLTNTDGKTIKIGGANGLRYAGCYTSDGGRIATDSIQLPSTDYKRIKFTVDKTAKTIKLTSNGLSETYKYTYDLGTVTAISISVGTAVSQKIYIDDITVRNDVDKSEAYANFATNEFYGGMFYSVAAPNENGIELKCAENQSGSYLITKANGSVRIELDEDCEIDYSDFSNIGINIEYQDSNYGFVAAEYDTASGIATTPTICCINSGTVKTQLNVVNDWVKNTKTGGYVLTLKTYEGNLNDGTIGAGERTYSKYPITIRSVRIYNKGTKPPVDVNIETSNTGNIFFEGETPKFSIKLNNMSQSAVSGNCEIKCYEIGKDSTVAEETETLIYSTVVEGQNIAGGAEYVLEAAVPVPRFGLYRLEAKFTDNADIVCVGEERFSKCAEVATQNYTMGVSAHFDQCGGATEGMKLLKKAGMGLVREDFIWSDYETKVSGSREEGFVTKYGLNPNQEEVCDAADMYGMKLLMIVSGLSWWYAGAFPNGLHDEAAFDAFNNYVTNLLNEPKVKKVCDMVEVLNEPNLKSAKNNVDYKTYPNGVTLYDDTLTFDSSLGYSDATKETCRKYSARGTAYGKMLKSASENIRKNAPNYKIGAFSLGGPWLPEDNYFMDRTLAELNDTNSFDAITCHPYMWIGQDAEKGYGGNDSSQPLHYIGYKLDYIKALATGTQVYNDAKKTWESPKGFATGNTYAQKSTVESWVTEYGASTADYEDDGLSCKGEYAQAIHLVRGYNQIKLNNFDNKVWFYNFADIGDRTNEKEFCFGIVHSRTDDVPFSAKYSYIALAALNKLTEGATSAETVLEDSYKFVSKYTSDKRNTYMLWTTKSTEQQIDYTFKDGVKFYDLLGNEISRDSVMKNGKYCLTREPYYAVEGEQPQCLKAEDSSAKLYFMQDGIGISEKDVSGTGESFDVLADMGGAQSAADLYAASYDKDGRLIQVKVYGVEPSETAKTIKNIAFEESGIDSIKLMLLDRTTIKPLCNFLKPR